MSARYRLIFLLLLNCPLLFVFFLNSDFQLFLMFFLIKSVLVSKRIKEAIFVCVAVRFSFFRLPASDHGSFLCCRRHCGVLPGHRLLW